MTTRGLLDNKKQGLTIPNLFDVDAIVVLTSPVLLEDCLHRQWVVRHRLRRRGRRRSPSLGAGHQTQWPAGRHPVVREHTGSFVSHFGNVSLRGYDAEQRFVQLQGSMGTELRSEVANGPHLNEVLTRSKGLLASLQDPAGWPYGVSRMDTFFFFPFLSSRSTQEIKSLHITINRHFHIRGGAMMHAAP